MACAQGNVYRFYSENGYMPPSGFKICGSNEGMGFCGKVLLIDCWVIDERGLGGVSRGFGAVQNR